MIAEPTTWQQIQQYDYILGTDGSTWRVDYPPSRAAMSIRFDISNAARQTAIVNANPNAPVTRLVPTESEALAVVRGVFPQAEEISHG